MNLKVYEDLGKEMGKTLTFKPFEDAAKIWSNLNPEQKQKAQEVFYKNAELAFSIKTNQSQKEN